jgi:two-component system OmpR family response regulator
VFTPGDPRVLIHDRPLFLTGQELALLELLAGNAGRVVNTATLAKLLARGHEPLTDTGVAVHVHRLRVRLESAGLQIRTLRGFGYLLETNDEESPR